VFSYNLTICKSVVKKNLQDLRTSGCGNIRQFVTCRASGVELWVS